MKIILILLVALAFLEAFGEEKIDATNVEPINHSRKQAFSNKEKWACGILLLGFIMELISLIMAEPIPEYMEGLPYLFGYVLVCIFLLFCFFYVIVFFP